MNRIILPLDNKNVNESIELMKKTSGKVWGYKLRRQIFEKGIDFIKTAREYGKVMVDFKFFDIPSAMAEAIELFNLADIITVHCTALFDPHNYNYEYANKLAGVTVLTSMTDYDTNVIFNASISRQIKLFGSFAEHHDYGYIVCSAKDLELTNFGIKKICPEIRPLWYQKKDDQERTMTPAEAIRAGADLLVIGRPLLKAVDIVAAIEKTNIEIEGVL